VAYQCKGRDQSNIVCEYDVNPCTIMNDNVITEIQIRKMIKLLQNNVKSNGHLKVTCW